MNAYKSKSTRMVAAVLAVLFVACAFSAVGTSSDAATENRSVDFSDLSELLVRSAAEKVPTAADVTITNESAVEKAYQGKTIFVESDVQLQNIGDITFDNCTILFKGSFKIVGGMTATFNNGYRVFVKEGNTTRAIFNSAGDSTAATLTATGTASYNCTVDGAELLLSAGGSVSYKNDLLSFTIKDSGEGSDASIVKDEITVNKLTYKGVEFVTPTVFTVVGAGVTVTSVSDTVKEVTKTSSTEIVAVSKTMVEELKADTKIVALSLSVKADAPSGTTASSTITLDDSSVRGLILTRDDITVKIDNVTSTLTDEQKKVVGDRPVFNIEMTGVQKVGEQVQLNGTATVSVPYTLKDGENAAGIVVYYVDASGNMEKVESSFVNGVLTFSTNHFSSYVVCYEHAGETSFSNNIPFYAAFAICLAILIAAFALNFRKI